jgi:Domain of unknown function (DUF4132)
MADPTPESLIKEFLNEAGREYQGNALQFQFGVRADQTESARKILALPRPQQVPVLLYAVAYQIAAIQGWTLRSWIDLSSPLAALHLPSTGSAPRMPSLKLTGLIAAILRKELPFTENDLCQLVGSITRISNPGWWSAASPAGIMKAIENHTKAHGLPGELRAALQQLTEKLDTQKEYSENRKLLQRVQNLLTRFAEAETAENDSAGVVAFRRSTYGLGSDEAWTKALSASLANLQPTERDRWETLLHHCALAKTSKPSGKWLKQAHEALVSIDVQAFASVLGTVLTEIGKPGIERTQAIYGRTFPLDPTQVHDTHSDLLRGLVWCTSLVDNELLTSQVGDAAETCFKKIPNVGPRAPKIGNGCLWALANKSSATALAQISRIKSTAKHASTRSTLEKALHVASEKTGLSAADLEELGVPTNGFQTVGECRVMFDEGTALLHITDWLGVELSWLDQNGRTKKSIPAAVTAKAPEQVKALKRTEKDLKKLLPAYRDRLERLFLQQRTWSLADFRTRYLDHPVIGPLARRIIWSFALNAGRPAGIWFRDCLVDPEGKTIQGLTDDTRVTIWHPHDAQTSQVLAWRKWLEQQEVRQPFKQAHREVYILTDAERQTATYSNRFAAHVIRQHQFSALCQARGWRYKLQGDWDSANTPTLELPLWNLQAEFWVEPVHEGGPFHGRADIGYTGVYLHTTTDQVRFARPGTMEPLLLDQVPSLVLSEVLRDVDLFVGVASVGNDPNWSDGGPEGRYRDYWQSYAFGDLSATAQTRKALLETLIPRLKIAKRCTLTDKYLVVQGDLRTYKIHLGSGNILMSPNDQYLCIVPGRGSTNTSAESVFLPFEGDNTLSIILSKAFLLAEDEKIADPTIMSQIERK